MTARQWAAIAGTILVSGCYAHAGVTSGYVEPAPPLYVDYGPAHYYQGRPAYYVNQRWYVRDGRHWRSYRREPLTLQRQRVRVQQAPPAYGRGRGRGGARPGGPERRAPNAVRVR